MALWFADSCAEKLGVFRKGLPTRAPQVPGGVHEASGPRMGGADLAATGVGRPGPRRESSRRTPGRSAVGDRRFVEEA